MSVTPLARSTGRRPGGEPGSIRVELPVVLRILGALVWILWGLKLYQPAFVVTAAPEMGLVYTVGGVVVLALSCAHLPERWAAWLDVVLLIGALVAFAFWTRVAVFGSPAYGTDEVAFDQGAAQLVLQGINPYGADLTWTLEAFRVLPSGTTNTLAGGFVHSLSYPAGAFLAYLPLLAAGVRAQAAIYVDALFWIVGMICLWLALPRPYRGLVPIIASLGIYVDYTTGGVTDSLMLPFLVGALWRWDRFGEISERSSARWIGPVALGLACTVKQSAWFIVPALIVAVAMESRTQQRGWRTVGRYIGLLMLAFLLPNIPFIVWNPMAWISGVLTPFGAPLVPFGQGLVAFSTTFFVGGGNLFAYTLAGGALMVAVLAAIGGWYPALKRLLPALPLIALLLPTRSLNSYFVYAIPGLLVAVTTIRPASGERLMPAGLKTVARLTAALGGAAAMVALAVALLTAPPLELEPVAQHTTGSLQSVDSLTVIAHNTSGHDLEPHFAVALGPYMSSYWIIKEGPSVLPGGAAARYVLLAPNTPSMPHIDQQSVLYALTQSPPTISSERLFPAATERTQLSPQAVNHVVSDPPEVTFSVQLVDRLNAPIHRAGVAVSLGQVLYTAEGLLPGQTSVNGQPEGQSPVSSKTDANGVAQFTVRAIQQQQYEVFFQAWLGDPFPHGYSAAVAVHFAVH